MPAWAGATRSTSSHRSVTLAAPRSPPRRTASSAATIQSGQACPGGTSFGDRRGHASLDVGGGSRALMGDGHGQDHVGQGGRGAEQRVDGHHQLGALEGLRGQGAVGEVPERVGAQEHDRPHLAVGQGAQHARRVTAPFGGHRAPRRLEPRPALVEADAPGQHPGCEPHVERAHDVAPAQGGQEARRRPGVRQLARAAAVQRAVLGQRGPAPDHDHPLATGTRRRQRVERRTPDAVVDALGGGSPAAQGPDQRGGLTGPVRQRRRGVGREGARARRQLDQGEPLVDHRATHAEEQHRQLLAQVARQDDEASRRARLVDGGAGQAEDHFGRQPVTELGVDRVGTEHAPWRAWPRRRRPRWRAGPRRSRRSPPAPWSSRTSARPVGHHRQRLGPRRRDELVAVVPDPGSAAGAAAAR